MMDVYHHKEFCRYRHTEYAAYVLVLVTLIIFTRSCLFRIKTKIILCFKTKMGFLLEPYSTTIADIGNSVGMPQMCTIKRIEETRYFYITVC